MKELINLWRDFMQEWRRRPGLIMMFDEKPRMLKPDFFDFMEWLDTNYDPH